jgi:SAM-dependent methyltransferase
MADKSWHEFYAKADTSAAQYLSELVVHRRFLRTILDRQPRRTIEVGCGTARMSVFLSHLGVKAVALDRDPGIVAQAGRISQALNGSVTFLRGDAFNLPFEDDSFDVSFHQGFLEHFTDEHIALLITEQLRIARSVVFSVPGHSYPGREFGDERLLPPATWKRILAPFRLVESRCYGPRRRGLSRLWRRARIMYLAHIER